MAVVLTKPQINKIIYSCNINHFPTIYTLKKLLNGKAIVPEGIPELVDTITDMYHKAQINSIIAFGNIQSEIISSIVLQLGLDQFKISNSLTSSSYSLKSLTEILFGTKNVSVPYTVINYKERLTMDEVFDSRKDIISITLGDLILDKTPLVPDYNSLPYKFFGIKPMKKVNVFRLVLNSQRMYAHSITLDQIKSSLEAVTNKFICVYGAYEDKILDLVPVVENMQSSELKDKTNASVKDTIDYIFEYNILPIILNYTIKGVSGIRRLIPAKRTLLTYCYDAKYKGENIWKVYVNERKLKYNALEMHHIRDMFAVVYEDVKIYYNSVKVVAEENPITRIRELIGEGNEDVIRMSEVWYCEGEGYINSDRTDKDDDDEDEVSAKDKADDAMEKKLREKDNTEPDLEELLCNPIVDRTKSYCNNVHTINSILGIEATRNYVIQTLDRIFISTGVNINGKYFILLADFLTNKGIYYGIFSTKFHKNAEYSFLEQANAGDALGTFTKFAIAKTKNEISNDLTSIATGELSKTDIINRLNDDKFEFNNDDMISYFKYTSSLEPTSKKESLITKMGIEESKDDDIKSVVIDVETIDSNYYDELYM